MFTPSSSVRPKVSCSGSPSGKRCRQRWNSSLTFAVKYIHLPSDDQPAAVHCPFAGPTVRPVEDASKGIRRHGSHGAVVSISTISSHLRLGERKERGAMPLASRGT